MNSVSVISRAYDAEAPYIKSFIEHYTSIGCQEFHIVVPKGNPYKYLEAECKELSNVKLYIDYENDTPLRGAQNVPLPHISTTHIISVDIDEYLDISNIQPLLEHDYVRLNWVIAPYFDIQNFKQIPGFIDRQCKYIVKTSICEALDDHDCTLKQPKTQYESEYKLIHYVYRSFNDLYLKCYMSNYGDYQAKNNDKLKTELNEVKVLPHKFKMAAIYQRIANAAHTTYPNFCKINYDLENKLVQESPFYENLFEYKKSLMHYSSRIDLNKLIKNMLQHKNYREYGRIPHHALSEISDKCIIEILEPEKWLKKSFSLSTFFLKRHEKNIY